MGRFFVVLFLLLPFWARAEQPQPPKLVVNVVVSGVGYEGLQRFAHNFSDGGFRRFEAEGTSYSAAYYGYMQTLTPAGLATLTTGVDPSMHGVVAETWIDYVEGSKIELTVDPTVQVPGGDPGAVGHSPLHIVMPTVGDKLLGQNVDSKVFSVAADPVSAVVAGGQNGTALWLDPGRATWVSSTRYMGSLPEWIVAHNVERPANRHIDGGWSLARPRGQYTSRRNTIFQGGTGRRITSFARGGVNNYNALIHTPIGNTLVAEFAALLVEKEGLGEDSATDILNVVFDASRWIGQRFGPSSMEFEDMILRLDMDLGQMVGAIERKVQLSDVLFVITSDHGLSEGLGDDSEGAVTGGRGARDAGSSFGESGNSSGEAVNGGRGGDLGEAVNGGEGSNGGRRGIIGHRESDDGRFNAAQFKTILNSFLVAQFGVGEWVLDYIDRQVYLNHNLVYKSALSLAEVQNRAAAFALQFRGVSHVLTSTALSGGYFGAGYGERMQRSFYPRRGGDLTLNFAPRWIEQRDDVRALSGSMWDDDTHVPLIYFGWQVPAAEVDERTDMTSVAQTVARAVGVKLNF